MLRRPPRSFTPHNTPPQPHRRCRCGTHLFKHSKCCSTIHPIILTRSNSIWTAWSVIPAIFIWGVEKCPIGFGEANIMLSYCWRRGAYRDEVGAMWIVVVARQEQEVRDEERGAEGEREGRERPEEGEPRCTVVIRATAKSFIPEQRVRQGVELRPLSRAKRRDDESEDPVRRRASWEWGRWGARRRFRRREV